MATIKMTDIARMSGVSIATVGRVIHNNGYVSEANRKIVEKIIQETGFVPNKMAQGLKKSKSMIIGHVTLSNPNALYAQIAEAVSDYARHEGYQVLTYTIHKNHDEEKQQIDALIGQQVDGVIITSNPHISKDLIEKLQKANIPVVLIERTQTIPYVDCIKVDDFKGAYDATQQMVHQGHKRIGFIGLSPSHEVEKDRYLGYKEALTDAGCFDESAVYFVKDYSLTEGAEGIEHLIQNTKAPTSVFLTSDLLAVGAMQYCYSHSIKIPDDLSITGYDNTLSALTAPPINSMRLPCMEIGKQAIRLLKRRMAESGIEADVVMIEPELVDRMTVIKNDA